MSGASVIADLSGPDLDAAVARELGMLVTGHDGKLYPPPFSSNPLRWVKLLEECKMTLTAPEPPGGEYGDKDQWFAYIPSAPGRGAATCAEGDTPGEAVCRCWLAGRDR